MHACTRVCECGHADVSWCPDLGVHPCIPPFEIGSHHHCVCQADQPVSFWGLSYLRLPFPCRNVGITDVPDTQPAFTSILGIQIQVLTFVLQVLYQPNVNYFTQFSFRFQFHQALNNLYLFTCGPPSILIQRVTKSVT